jgi:precorrin isomerase
VRPELEKDVEPRYRSYNEAMEHNTFPQGWDEERVRRVLEHYEKRTEDEAVAEDEAAWLHKQITACASERVGSDLDLDEDLERTGIEALKKSDDE